MPHVGNRLPAVAVCHPHPRFGGDMHNGVVVAVAERLRTAGLAALRFNYRGVGGSGGAYDGGAGEGRDTEAALTFLSSHRRIDVSRLGIAGYSFGAGIALRVAHQNSLVQAVASIACPVGPFTEMGVRQLLQPKLLICGELDHDFPVDQFKFLAQRFTDPKDVEVLYGADHFFVGRHDEIGEMVAGFFLRCLADTVGPEPS